MAAAMDVPEATREFLASRHPDELELALWLRRVVLDAEPDARRAGLRRLGRDRLPPP